MSDEERIMRHRKEVQRIEGEWIAFCEKLGEDETRKMYRSKVAKLRELGVEERVIPHSYPDGEEFE